MILNLHTGEIREPDYWNQKKQPVGKTGRIKEWYFWDKSIPTVLESPEELKKAIKLFVKFGLENWSDFHLWTSEFKKYPEFCKVNNRFIWAAHEAWGFNKKREDNFLIAGPQSCFWGYMLCSHENEYIVFNDFDDWYVAAPYSEKLWNEIKEKGFVNWQDLDNWGFKNEY